MPEGDTVYRTAKNLNAAIAGSVLTRCDIRVPAFATVDLSGELVHDVSSRGKHLLMRIGDHTIHSHLKMEGSWHLYRHGTKWRRPAHSARAVLETADWVAVGYSLGVVEVVATDDEESIVGYLGPDLLGPDWDADEAQRRMMADPERPIGLALLDQRVLAGLGNVYRNELCFLRGILPTRPAGQVDDPRRLIALAYSLIHANKDRVERTTTGTLRGATDWVHGRRGKPCLRCGTPIREGLLGETVLQERETFWCPRCQT
ncbi:Fpg/Nei family DNA glycosylase [Marisediminicola senii]|uniref:Fpg/Nei family DNA glycosylase n=1 Tax=Marisediminicola senii TaxID=2711233 RepID=UPI0013EE0422|nr:Fpg/Nei family DNA glycosylase [Marisediminicola senii]